MSNARKPSYLITTPGGVPERIDKPSVGMDDEIHVIYPDVSAGMETVHDRVPRREVCARLDGFPEVEILRTDRDVRLVSILNPEMLIQWMRTRSGGWDGQLGDLGAEWLSGQ